MKKIVLSAAIAATMLTFTACNSCGEKRQPALLVEAEVDSLYMVNDTTMADKQTFIFEGLMPMENGKPGNVLLAIESISLNDDGTYTVSTTYIDENANPVTKNDSGETIVMVGIPNDSTAIVYEFISDNNKSKTHMQMNSDSSFTRLGKDMKPVSKNPAHRLIHKKTK